MANAHVEIPRSAIDALVAPAERYRLIAEAAYFLAEQRGFAPGHALADWLEAEREVNRASGLLEPKPHWHGR